MDLAIKNCCGCGACAQKCPKKCISMCEDREGFLYPEVDESRCIDCGLCEKVCHELHPYEERNPQKVYAVINKDEEIRLKSSSGGIFYLLAEKVISDGGVIFGVRFDKDWQVVLDYAETLDDVKSFMGSKYVQSRTATAYQDAENFLKKGRRVLFSGTPCQIAGLYHYLRKEFDNLTTLDFVCHGVPSPKVWRRYLDEVVSASKSINDVKFRNKRDGWKKFNFVMSYEENGSTTSLYSNHQQNHYMRAFLSDMILRPSCHDCRAKCGRSHSDITIADFWGIDQVMPEMDDDKGTGLVLVNTEKGKQALDWNRVRYKESSIEVASKYNGGLSSHTEPHPKREQFFALLDETESVTDLISKCLRPPLKRRIRMLLGKCKRLPMRILRKISGGGEIHLPSFMK